MSNEQVSLNISIIKHNLNIKIISCSFGGFDDDLGQLVTLFNDDGPVYGPNGEWELDPDNYQCYDGSIGFGFTRPVFATCKNNCPGGELSTELFSNIYKH